MTLRPTDLPDFENPPVVETLLSVQFDRLSLPKSAHFGLYWSQIRSKFPRSEEQGELPAIVEKHPEQPQPTVGIQFQAFDAPPTPRFWFINKDGTELIQIQRDRFIKNWRKIGDENEYPRYETVRAGFDQDFADFAKFVTDNGLGTLRVNQCEVTYINHIVAGEGWDTYADIDRVFRVWRQPNSPVPGRAEEVAIRAKFPILHAGEFCGRLHLALQPVKRISDGKPMFLMELTARGQIGEGTEFFDIGRSWIVKSFAELTTKEMHEAWGRKA
jgi:uncharacterized protein (TIGR04255 family)